MNNIFRQEAVEASLEAEISHRVDSSRRGLWVSGVLALGLIGLGVVVPFEQVVRVQGVVRPQGQDALLRASVGGVLASIQVVPGQRVALGATLVWITSPELQGSLSSAQADLKFQGGVGAEALQIQQAGLEQRLLEQKLQVDLAKERVERARDLLDRQSKLFMEGLAAKTAQLQAEDTFAEAKANYSRARQQVMALEADSKELTRKHVEAMASASTRVSSVVKQQEGMVLSAPCSGRVEWVSEGQGRVVRPGDALVRLIPDGAPLGMEGFLPVEHVGKVALGRPCRVFMVGHDVQKFGEGVALVESIGKDVVASFEASTEVPGLAGTGFLRIKFRPSTWPRITPEAGQLVEIDIRGEPRSLGSRLLASVR